MSHNCHTHRTKTLNGFTQGCIQEFCAHGFSIWKHTFPVMRWLCGAKKHTKSSDRIVNGIADKNLIILGDHRQQLVGLFNGSK